MLLVALLPGCTGSSNDALFDAINAKDAEKVRRILAEGKVDLEPRLEPGSFKTPLAFAAAFGNLDIVEQILEAGADINGKVSYGDVPLTQAAIERNKDIMRYLIEEGADVNIPNAFGISPFIGFCGYDDIEFVQLGLDHGGLINQSYESIPKSIPPRHGMTALQMSVFNGYTEIARLLLASGGDPLIKDSDGKTCLDIAREQGHDGIVELLN